MSSLVLNENNLTVQAHAAVEGLDFSAMKMLLLHEAAEHELSVFENTETGVQIESPYGAFGISALSNGVKLNVASCRKDHLYVIREALVGHLEHYMPEVAKTVIWSDAPKSGTTPPNFQFATVVRTKNLCADFVRLTIKLSKTEMFTDASIHFRFALPQPGDDAPEWPTLKENGSVKWPSGDKELHRPVYTVAAMDQSTGEAEIDIFRHEGGRTLDWATGVAAGEQVALLGPGGGGVLNEKKLLICGDETAYPAIARILAGLPEDAQCEALLLSHNGNHDYPFPDAENIKLKWTVDSEGFAAQANEMFAGMSDAYLWFAGGAEQVKTMRKVTKPLNIPKGRSYLGVFWH